MECGGKSRLTVLRPGIWRRAMALSTSLTGYNYAPKEPLPDGTIYACGYSDWTPQTPPPPKTNDEIRRERVEEIDRDIAWKEEDLEELGKLIERKEVERAQLQIEIDELKKERASLLAVPTVYVPEGSMEWLLHEVGHWLAASEDERLMQNYGLSSGIVEEAPETISEHGQDREWQAWAFEEIVLTPFGASRLFAAPSCREGVAFAKNLPIPSLAMQRAERKMREHCVDLELWRGCWSDWVTWGQAQGEAAPWRSEN